MLITDVPSSREFSGTLLTWHLCKNLSKDTMVGAYVMDKGLSYVKSEYPFKGKPVEFYYTKKSELSYRPKFLPRKLGFMFGYFRELYRKYFEVNKIAADIAKNIAEQGVDRIWIILQGQTMIWLCENLIRRNIVPVNVQVWDYPQWAMKAHKLERFSKKMLSKSFDFCIANCHKYGAPSWEAQKAVLRKYNKQSSVFIGITPAEYQIPRKIDFDKRDGNGVKRIIIGIVGQLYADDAFVSLVHALDLEGWKIDGREVELHFWGRPGNIVHRNGFVQRKYVPQDQLMKEISDCDFMYCPYWFGEIFKEEAKTSFPSKLATYLVAGIPVLFHGPDYCSPAKFIKEHNCGVICARIEPQVVMLNVRKILFDKEVIQEQLANAKTLVSTYLSEKYLHNQFQSFIS